MKTVNKAPLGLAEKETPFSKDDSMIVSCDRIQIEQRLADDIAAAYPAVGNAEDAASILGVPVTTVRALCRQGILRGFKVGNLWRIPRISLLRFIVEGGCNG